MSDNIIQQTMVTFMNSVIKCNSCKKYKDNLFLELKSVVDFNHITENELISFGCYKVNTGGSVNGMEIYLIPSYILPILPIGLKVYEYYDGREIIYDGSNINMSDELYLEVGLIPFNKK